MTIVRGSDLAKCLQRPTTTMASAMDDASSDEDVSALVQLMRVCFQGDSDVESVVSTLQRRFGDMKVRLLPLLWLY